MIYLKTKHYSGLSFRRTRPLTRYHMRGAEGRGSQRGCGPSAGRRPPLPSACGCGPRRAGDSKRAGGRTRRPGHAWQNPQVPTLPPVFPWLWRRGTQYKWLNASSLCPSQSLLLPVPAGIYLVLIRPVLAQRRELPGREGRGAQFRTTRLLSHLVICGSASSGG